MANAASQLRSAKAAYEQLYAKRRDTQRRAANHPVIVQTLREGRCAICGSTEDHVVGVLEESLADAQCPLCDSELPKPPAKGKDRVLMELETIGKKIVQFEQQVNEQRCAFERHREEADKAEERLRKIRGELEEFRKQNNRALARISTQQGVEGDATVDLQNRISDLLERKSQERKRRDSARRELKKLQQKLVEAYSRVEHEFVPRFQELAQSFLGVPLEIDLDQRSSGVSLRLSLANSNRRQADKLSESQRFFVDIALRMALAQQMSSIEHPACMYIDTPEGSLDIAYESRAGGMFGDFVKHGNQLVMTANINTSELLHNLASICGLKRMQLMRMTEWTALTDVQQDAEDLFERAYGEIEAKLESGG